MKAYAISDGVTIIEATGTGHLCIYYALDDAVTAFPAVKRGFSQKIQKELRICSVEISPPKRLPPRRG
jgi:hypothetical protein